jgi:hypothetical protein
MKRKSQNTLQNIKTLSDRVSDAEKPQRKYIKLAILELEKVRRSKEKNKAREHMTNLDKRLAEIETEQARLIEAVYVVNPGVGTPAIGAPHAKKFIPDNNQDNTSQNIENNTDFKITY